MNMKMNEFRKGVLDALEVVGFERSASGARLVGKGVEVYVTFDRYLSKRFIDVEFVVAPSGDGSGTEVRRSFRLERLFPHHHIMIRRAGDAKSDEERRNQAYADLLDALVTEMGPKLARIDSLDALRAAYKEGPWLSGEGDSRWLELFRE